MKSLSGTIRTNKFLQQIYMSHNQLSNNALGLLAEGLIDNTVLSELFLTHNDLS